MSRPTPSSSAAARRMRAPIACCVGSNGGAALSASYGSAEAVARRRALSVMLSTPRCTQWYTRPRGWSGLARAGAYGCVLPHHPTYTFSLNVHTQIFLSFHQLSFLSIDSFTLDFAYEYNHQRKMGWGTSAGTKRLLYPLHTRSFKHTHPMRPQRGDVALVTYDTIE